MNNNFDIKLLNKKLDSLDYFFQLLCISVYLEEINDYLQTTTGLTGESAKLLRTLNNIGDLQLIQPQTTAIKNLAVLQKRLTNKY